MCVSYNTRHVVGARERTKDMVAEPSICVAWQKRSSYARWSGLARRAVHSFPSLATGASLYRPRCGLWRAKEHSAGISGQSSGTTPAGRRIAASRLPIRVVLHIRRRLAQRWPRRLLFRSTHPRTPCATRRQGRGKRNHS